MKFSMSCRRRDPGFSESKEMNMTSVSKVRDGSVVSRFEKRADVKSADVERIRSGSRIQLNITRKKNE
jgi:hypothetical protein